MEKTKKKFRLFDAILGTVCLTLVCESVMPTAAIGNTQYFWWILLLVGFCLPYGMITAELGTTYPSEGGMYDWVKRAFGPKWAGRVAWNYWVNFPLWIASLAVALTDIVAGIFSIELPIWALLLIQLAYVWLVTFLGTQRIGESKYIVNLGTFFKIVLLLGIGLLGIYVFIKTGQSANPINGFGDLIPAMNLENLSFISIILFNFMGFEVVGTWAEDMENPKKDIPKAKDNTAILKMKACSICGTDFRTYTNHSGGIQGGISNGEDIYFRVAFKPVATILKEQETIDLEGNKTTLKAHGRHDPCVLPRAVPIVEAMAAMTIYDNILSGKSVKINE